MKQIRYRCPYCGKTVSVDITIKASKTCEPVEEI